MLKVVKYTIDVVISELIVFLVFSIKSLSLDLENLIPKELNFHLQSQIIESILVMFLTISETKSWFQLE